MWLQCFIRLHTTSKWSWTVFHPPLLAQANCNNGTDRGQRYTEYLVDFHLQFTFPFYDMLYCTKHHWKPQVMVWQIIQVLLFLFIFLLNVNNNLCQRESILNLWTSFWLWRLSLQETQGGEEWHLHCTKPIQVIMQSPYHSPIKFCCKNVSYFVTFSNGFTQVSVSIC